MKYLVIKILPLLLFLNGYNTFCQQVDTSKVIARGATIQLISRQFSFTEGPAVDKKGNVFFTDQPNDKIWKYAVDGKLSIYLDKTGRANGLYFDKRGNLLACADEDNQLWSIDKKKQVTILLKDYKSQKLNGPNDLWIDASGGIYFTDPYYKRPYWTRTSLGRGEYVYYITPESKEIIVVDSTLRRPNGIVGTANGEFLYVADIGSNKTWRYKIEKDGTLSHRILFAQQGSDGMTLDNNGNVYLTGNGVTVYDSSGKQVEHIAVPAKWTANVCFGGKKRDQLFITASEAVYTIAMKVKGIE